MTCKEEKWVDLIGYEQLYKVSNLGNIFSIRRNRKMNPSKNQFGYYMVHLKKGKITESIALHRVIARQFIKKPKIKKIKSRSEELTVNHKDFNKTNNSVENLEWITRKENILHSFTRKDRVYSYPRLWKNRKVYCISLDGKKRLFNSITEATKSTSILRTAIENCLAGRSNTAGKLIWKYQ